MTAAFTPWPIGPNMGSCGTAAFTRKRVIISDISEDPRWPLMIEAWLRGGWFWITDSVRPGRNL